MALGRNKEVVDTISVEELQELRERAEQIAPQKLVIVAGTSFGTVLKFLLLGAAIGAAITTLVQNRAGSSEDEDPVLEGISTGGAKGGSTLRNRAQSLLGRVKGLGGTVRDLAQVVAENAKPVLDEVVQHAKETADETEKDFKDELRK